MIPEVDPERDSIDIEEDGVGTEARQERVVDMARYDLGVLPSVGDKDFFHSTAACLSVELI